MRETTGADRLMTDGPIFKSADKGHDDGMKAPQEEPSVITADDVRMIQESFRRVESVRASAAERFFRELFSYDETLRGLFPPDRWSREEQLMSDVRGLSDGLAQPDKFKLAIDSLARRLDGNLRRMPLHLYIGAAWFSTLEMILGSQFDRRLHAAWFKFFEQVVAELRAVVSVQTKLHSTADTPLTFAHASAA